MPSSPSPDNYQLGKGVLYFNEKVSGVFQGFLDLGNTPNFSFNMSLEKLEHFSSRGGLRAKDKSVISQITPQCSFTLDEFNVDNLALLTMGTITEQTQTPGSVSDEAHTGYQGKRIQLAKRQIGVASVAVTGTGGTPTYTVNTDYVVDTGLKDDVIGRVLIVEGGTIADGTALEISYDYDGATYNQISSFVNTSLEGTLHFIGDNPVGNNQELKIWRVSLTPEGDTALIGDDWATMTFTGEILKVSDTSWDGDAHTGNPYMEVITDVVHVTTTTTTA